MRLMDAAMGDQLDRPRLGDGPRKEDVAGQQDDERGDDGQRAGDNSLLQPVRVSCPAVLTIPPGVPAHGPRVASSSRTTSTTKLRLDAPTLPVTSQQPVVGKIRPDT